MYFRHMVVKFSYPVRTCMLKFFYPIQWCFLKVEVILFFHRGTLFKGGSNIILKTQNTRKNCLEQRSLHDYMFQHINRCNIVLNEQFHSKKLFDTVL